MANIQPKEERFQIKTRDGELLNLDKATVVKYITNGVPITDPEFNMFFQLCKTYGANPFLREAYLVKYGSSPATIVLDYKVFQQIAENNSHYRGMRHGVIVADAEGKVIERIGAYKLPSETIIAGWCEVLRDDKEPTKAVAMFEEFKNVKKDGSANSNWSSKPCFMIDKVAKAHALREAFPNAFGSNVYVSEEIDIPSNKASAAGAPKTNVDLSSIVPQADTNDAIDVEPEQVTDPISDGDLPF